MVDNMNKKGFTLVELLAVIVVLAILILLAMPRVTTMMEKARVNSFVVEANEIMKVAQTAYNDKVFDDDSTSGPTCFTVDQLIDGGYLDKDKGEIRGAVVINASSTTTVYSYLSKENYYIRNNTGAAKVSSEDVQKNSGTPIYNDCTSTCTGNANGTSVKCSGTEIIARPNNSNPVVTVCTYLNNTYSATPSDHTSIGTAYNCNPGDGNTYKFYVLAKSGNQVKLIMEQNLSDTVGTAKVMTWENAMAFLESGGAGYATKQAWNRVISMDHPTAQEIMDASLAVSPKDGFSVNFATSGGNWWCLGSHVKDESGGPTYCFPTEAQQKVAWLFSYTRDCISRGCYYEYPASGGNYTNGYWTKTKVATSDTSAWFVFRYGSLHTASITSSGSAVRPVITVYTSNLSG